MIDVIVFHHAHGLTPGVRSLGDHLSALGHRVHAPDLFDGYVAADLAEGVAHAEEIGFEAIVERGAAAGDGLDGPLTVVGFSLGVLPAQRLAQTVGHVSGAVLVSACVPTEYFGGWRTGTPVQVHAMENDPIFVGDGDIDAARELTATESAAHLYLYPGDSHIFTDPTVAGYDAVADELFRSRLLAFLADVTRA